MSSNNYNIDEATELLFQGYKNEMVNEGVHFSSEVRRWFNLWSNKSYQKKQKNDTAQTHAGGQSEYMVEIPRYSFGDVLKVADVYFFLNIRKLLLTGATSTIRSSEVERTASGIIRLKTAFRNNIKDERGSNLNLLQMHTTGSINVEELQMFIKKEPRRLFSLSLVILVKHKKVYVIFTLRFDILH